jgi:hypothetical protein
MIEQANKIVVDYQRQGFSLTLRQLYYQFVARDLIPNKQTEYKRLGSVINDARLAGLIDWTAIEDRTRNLRKVSTWDTPNDILRSAASSFKLDLWENQDNYCEVWIEKDALVGVIEPTCNRKRVPFFSCRGYSSQSEQWEAGQRIARRINDGKRVTVFHLGDHDPSGLDMTRDNEDRLRMFIAEHADANMFEIERLALNMEQVRTHNPPPNPAKMTDSRFGGYATKYGNKSWELDALEPKMIAKLIGDNINSVIDDDQWSEDEAKESSQRDRLHNLADTMNFDEE